MRPLRFSINVTLDGCADHRAGVPDEELHAHAAETIARADALIFGRVMYGLMEAGWRERSSTAGTESVFRMALHRLAWIARHHECAHGAEA